MTQLDLNTNPHLPGRVEVGVFARPGKRRRTHWTFQAPRRHVWHADRTCPDLAQVERSHQSRAARRGADSPPTVTFIHDIGTDTDVCEEQLRHYLQQPCNRCALAPSLVLSARIANVLAERNAEGPEGDTVRAVLISCLLHTDRGTCHSCSALRLAAAALGQIAADTGDGRVCFAMRLCGGSSFARVVAVDTTSDMALSASADVLALADELAGTEHYRRGGAHAVWRGYDLSVRVDVSLATAILEGAR